MIGAGGKRVVLGLSVAWVVASAVLGAHAPAEPATAQRIVIAKRERTLTLYIAGEAAQTFHDIRLGAHPDGPKRFEGDGRTPEGEYRIDGRNAASRYNLSLHISYPNGRDWLQALLAGRSPGGQIYIHGQPNGSPFEHLSNDWTRGCIALTNAQIERLWQRVAPNTPVSIRP